MAVRPHSQRRGRARWPFRTAAIALLASSPVAVMATHAAPGLPRLGADVSLAAVATAPTPAADDAPPRAVPTTTTTTAPAPAAATTTTTTTPPAPDPWADRSPGWEQRRGEHALASLHYPWQQLGYPIRFEPARAGYLGLTDPVTRTVTVWVRPELTPADLVSILAHELGHVVDLVSTTGAERARYLEVRGLGGGLAWDPCDDCEDYGTVAGDWAESFAEWLVGSHGWRSKLGPPPGADQLAALAPLFSP